MKLKRSYAEYEDAYDKHTVETCRRIRSSSKSLIDDKDISSNKALSDKEKAHLLEVKELWLDVVKEIHTFCYAADRYVKKQQIIQGWQQEDEAKDKFLKETKEPENSRCRGCLSAQLKVISKDYWWGSDANNHKALFMFKCSSCGVNTAYFDNGEEWELKNETCPECYSGNISSETTKGRGMITTHYGCLDCLHDWSSKLDARTKKAKDDPDYIEDRKLYCYSDKVKSYTRDLPSIESLKASGLIADMENKSQERVDELDISKIKKLKVSEVAERLDKVLSKQSFSQFQLGQREVGKNLTISFTVIDDDKNRNEDLAHSALWKTASKSLADTNWRIVRGSIDYRLGLITARLRGHEVDKELSDL